MVKKRSNKIRDLILLVFWVVIIALVNFLGSFFFQRFDLTSENRYSLSSATKELVRDLDDVVFVRVYLEGDLPADIKRLRDETQEMLNEFRAYSNGKLEYEFIDPSESPDEKTRLAVYQQLSEQGLQYTSISDRQVDKVSEKIIFPGAIFTFRETEIPLQLLKSQIGASREIMINNSIQQLEYEIASVVTRLVRSKREKIAFVEGHGELEQLEVADIMNTLHEFYTVERVKIDGQLNSLDDYDAIVIAKPDSAFSDKDKFIIDRFIMGGGKSLWLVDAVYATMDSLSDKSTTMGIPLSVNLEDQLFKYGVRINSDLLMDLQALPIPIVTGYTGNQPKQEFFPWFYFPLLMPGNNHPIVHNLDAIKTTFVSSIDTVGSGNTKKTILLTTSANTRLVKTPMRISLNELRSPPDEKQYARPYLPVAVLIEGEFESVFSNRIPPEIETAKSIGFKDKSKPTKMIVVADGDIIRNDVNKEKHEFLPLGYDKYTRRQYGNKDFILNSMNYLCDDSGLIEARGKEFKLRLLDKQKTDREYARWQALNTIIPVLVILLFGLAQYFLRRRRNT